MLQTYNTNENPNHWYGRGDKRQDTSNSPYYRQPVHNPLLNEKFAIAAVVCGMLALFCNCVFIVPISLSCFGFLFCALAYRKGKRSSRILKNGIFFSCVGLVAGLVSCVTFFTVVLPRTLQDPVVRQQTGILIDTYLRLFKDVYGIDFGTTAEQILNSFLH